MQAGEREKVPISKSLLTGLMAGAVVGAGVTVFALTSGGVGDAAGGGRPSGPPQRGGYTPVVSMAVAEAANISRRVEVIGRARSLKSVAITSEVTGLVEEVNFGPGKRVAQGDILVQVDDDEAQVALSRARTQLPIARDNAARYRNLAQDEAASALEAEQAQTTLNTLQADLRAAEVAVERRKIRAPFDGIAGLTELEPGDYLRAGDPVTTLDDTSSIIIEFSVPQESAGFVNLDQAVTATLTSDAGAKFEGEITGIDSRVDPESRTLRVEARVENEQGRLIPGAVLAVSTVAVGEPAVAVPGLALQWDRGGAFVWRRNAEGAAERAGVVILQRTDNLVLVEGEINVGDIIVAEGADRARAGVALPSVESRSRNEKTVGSVSSTGAAGGED
ncbi:efflux RND transporter periplasmic adaptor subunit [Hyphococcus flavus]|uniref:Efflux RND transporter periplasmic adaptor subunit n=1 Tax=Hyphococcus flavus TaxID=1866326 RepID=A0AAE9ZD55_9PROT|nr:efflux RND transporter periplasmic adaptor subunit [Hyphococcus flavus]WDI32524.1 efflux RND transporter periplasmic adaptor subunit [Hyphococcus flavus]